MQLKTNFKQLVFQLQAGYPHADITDWGMKMPPLPYFGEDARILAVSCPCQPLN